MGFNVGLMFIFYLAGCVIYTMWGRWINGKVGWPFPFGCCWSLGLHFFLCGLLIDATAAISENLEKTGRFNIGMLMPQDFNTYDVLVISLTGAVATYMGFAWMKGMQAGHVEADAFSYPWEEYAGMGLIDSAKYWVITFVLCSGSAVAGHALGKFLTA